ncbi:MAG TPA: hypothetical protein VG759_22525 [Candidatus Angelobacter sp.]|jgi:hypothetical protein|nr:hypothetical protein [Candidatus Angelobacter sp.]
MLATVAVRSALVICLFLAFPKSGKSQNASPASGVRDPQAAALLQKSIAAMGGVAPADSTAEGVIVVVAGSAEDQGKIGISTRGPDQCAEHIDLPKERRSIIYSRGDVDESSGGALKPASLELAAGSPCADFPLPLLVSFSADQDTSLEYIGPETLDTVSTHHIRLSKTFASKKGLEFLAEFSKRDVWLDSETGLPVKLAYQRREARGRTAPVRIEVRYSNWQIVRGVAYPFQIEKSWNGTPWATITVQSVAFQTGLTDADFPIAPRTGVK